MKRLIIRIHTLAPVLITSNTGDANMVSTCNSINGTTILGLFARKYLSVINNIPDPVFLNLFLRGGLRFTNATIVCQDKKSVPVPFSVHSEKHNDSNIFDLALSPADIDSKAIGNFGIFENVNDKTTLTPVSVNMTMNFHHERESNTGITRKSIIFNYLSIDAGQIFETEIIGEEDDLKKVQNLFDNDEIAYIGRSRSAQYGKIKLEVSKIIEISQGYSGEGKGEIIMTLLSETIIYNENGFSTNDIKQIEKIIGVKITKSFIRSAFTEQFDNQWKLKKPSETVYAAGSCFVLEKLPIDYSVFEKQGIGFRTNEGFGQVIFGLQVAKKYDKTTTFNLIKKPIGVPPVIAKKIMHDLIIETLEENIVLKALNDAFLLQGDKHNEKISNSLLGRLTSFVKNPECDFNVALKELRDTARKQLESIYIGHTNVFEYLKKIKESIGAEVVEQLKNEKWAEFEIKPSEDQTNKFHKIYLLNFFNQIRRNNKKGE